MTDCKAKSFQISHKDIILDNIQINRIDNNVSFSKHLVVMVTYM